VNDVPPWVILSILGVASALSRSARSVSTEIRMILGRCFVDCWPEQGSPARNIQAAMTVASATRNQTIHPSILSPTPQTSRLRFSAIFLENEAPEEAQEGLLALFCRTPGNSHPTRNRGGRHLDFEMWDSAAETLEPGLSADESADQAGRASHPPAGSNPGL
jgi:hypothetical protein